MGNFRVYKDIINYTINSQSEQDSLFPASNLKLIERQFRYTKTTTTGNNWWILDFGVAKQINSVVLLNTNFTTYKVQGDSTTSFVSPLTDSGNLTIAKEPFRERYYHITNPQNYSPAFNYRYMRIYVPTQSTTDGESAFKLGGLIVTDQAEDLITNPDYGLEIVERRSSNVNTMLGGSDETINFGKRFTEFTFSIRPARVSAEFLQLAKTIVNIDRSTSLIIAFNGSLAEQADNTPFVYVTRRIEDSSYIISDFGVAVVDRISLREQI